eukprot:5563497-Pleurochrysis_carterae.AAC.1
MSRSGSNSRASGRPSSPTRSSRLWASRAAAHSTTPLAELRSNPAAASCAKCAARNARLSRLAFAGPSSLRMPFSASGSRAAAAPGTTSLRASLER